MQRMLWLFLMMMCASMMVYAGTSPLKGGTVSDAVVSDDGGNVEPGIPYMPGPDKDTADPNISTAMSNGVDSIGNGLVWVVIDANGDFVIRAADGRNLLFRSAVNGIYSTDIRVKIGSSVYDLTAESGCNSNTATFISHVKTATDLTCYYRIGGTSSNPNYTVKVVHTPVMLSAATGMILTRTVVVNRRTDNRNIGILYEYDTMIGSDDNAMLYLGPTQVTTETCYSAPFSYPYWQAVQHTGDLVGCGFVSGYEAVCPDKLAFGYWGTVQNNQGFYSTCWDRVCTGDPYTDSAVLYQWNQVSVAPGDSMVAATYYGVCNGTEQPGRLEVRVTDVNLQCINHEITPNPFQVLVTVANTGQAACHNVVVTLDNGSGPGGTGTVQAPTTHTIGTIAGGSNGTTTFTVDLTNNPAGGCVNFTAHVSSQDCDPNTLDFCVHVPECKLPCRFYSCEQDMGDLYACNYPTKTGNPAHMLTNVAWIGDTITAEAAPHILNQDGGDDGILFLNTPWTPCHVESVQVIITTGQEYGRYLECGGHLFLSAWKDGNLDGDFTDTYSCGQATADEWIIHDAPIPGPGTYRFGFLDPGDPSLGHPRYEGRLRFRLMSGQHGRYGFGLYDPDCYSQGLCYGNFGLDSIGEVQDYIEDDLQLAVQLSSFSAVGSASHVTLDWVTASEAGNDHFEIMRDGARLISLPSLGNDVTGHTYRYVDENVAADRSYTYELVAVDQASNTVHLGTRTVSASPVTGTVSEYALYQNYPNPFNPVTTIAFDLPEAGFVSLKVYNMAGQEVATLVRSTMSPGHKTVSFDAAKLPSALYIYRLEAGSFVMAKKMLLTK